MRKTPFALRAVTALAVASPLILPAAAWAQPTPRAAKTLKPPRPANDMAATPAVEVVEVTVDWVDLPDTDVSVTNVGLGPNHDGRLMAALIQNGAIDTKGQRLLAKDEQFAAIHVKTDVPTTVTINGKPRDTVLHLDNFTEATPTVFDDKEHTIWITGGIQREGLLPGSDPPAAVTDFVPLHIETFVDGEPLLIGGVGEKGTAAQRHFLFVTVKTVRKAASGQASRR